MVQRTARAQFWTYFLVSNVLPFVMFAPVLRSSPNVYSAGIRLFDGDLIIVLCNWLIAVGIIVGIGLQHLLFGPLRPVEIDHIYQNSGMSLMNSLLALVMFTDSSLVLPVLLTLYLQFVKVFHWILKDRFEHLFQHATRARQILKSKSVFALFLFLFIDFKSVYSCAVHLFGNSPDVYFAFGFQFVILFLDLLLLTCKIALNVWELHYVERHPDEDVLEGKDVYMKIIELTHTSANLLIDFFLLYTFIGPTRFPIYLFQNIFSKLLSFVKQLSEFKAYLKASKELDSKLRDATEDDLTEDNSLCIICREDMTLEGTQKGDRLFPKKLHCGHIIHMGCLKSWFERSQVCPMCRAPVLTNDPTSQQEEILRQRQQEIVRERQREVQDMWDLQQQQQQQQQQNGLQPVQGQVQSRGTMPMEERPTPTFPPRTGISSNSETINSSNSPNSDNILRLSPNSLVPPDWTLLKLISNPSSQHQQNRYQLRLNSTQTAQIHRISQHPTISPAVQQDQESVTHGQQE